MKRHVALVGFMASGKSTVGRRVARRLGCAFADTDELVVRAHGAIAGIFAGEGEEAFRRYEREVIAEVLAAEEARVVALGGGAFVLEENRTRLKSGAHVVFVKASPEQVSERLRKSRTVRPLLGAAPSLEAIEALYRQRLPYYAAADLVVDARSRTGEQVVDEIVKWIRKKKIAIGR
ncbi:MAG: shikimate kinase [Candidatus Baltobacteraceae bacterium]